MECIELGPSPVEESCAQLGVDGDYPDRSRIECRVWMNQLERTLPIPAELAANNEVFYKIRTSEHDAGTYREVYIVVQGDNSAALDFAYNVQSEAPLKWDEKARIELKEKLVAAELSLKKQ